MRTDAETRRGVAVAAPDAGGSRGGLHSGRRGAALLAGLLAAAVACAAPVDDAEWGAKTVVVGVDLQSPGDVGAPTFDRLMPLAKIFYSRITSRRFNSKATYDDPGLREFFHSVEAFADYYANFAQALEIANFESHRPDRVTLERIERVAPDQVKMHVRFAGENGQPLRWWSTHLEREDLWEFVHGRWWIVPGKV